MSEVISYKLTGDWRHIIDDGLVDPDALPDEALPTGHVEFIPVSPQVAVSGSPDTAYTVSRFKSLIAAGVLTDLQGREGVHIAGKVGDQPILWRAKTHLEFRGQKIDYPTIEFTLEADARLTGILASHIPGGPATIYHPRIEALIAEVDGKSDIGHLHQITDVEGLQQALEDAANSGGTGEGGSGGPVSWTQVTDKPEEFPPEAHTHIIGDVDGLQGALDAKVGDTDPRLSDARDPKAHTHSWASLTGKPSTFLPEEHNHQIADVEGLQQALDAAASSGGDGTSLTPGSVQTDHLADGAVTTDKIADDAITNDQIGDSEIRERNILTWAVTRSKLHGDVQDELDGLRTDVDSKSDTGHGHQISDVDGLQQALEDAANSGTGGGGGDGSPVTWTSVTGKPSEFPPESHTHLIEDVGGLQAELDAKAGVDHEHEISDVAGLQAALDAAASSGGDGSGGGADSGPRLFTNNGYPYTSNSQIPDPRPGDMFWTVSSGNITTRTDDGVWHGQTLTPGYNTVDRSRLATAVERELDDLREDVDSKVEPTDPRLSDARTPTEHSHEIEDVNGLQDALDTAGLGDEVVQTGHIAPEAVTQSRLGHRSVGLLQMANNAVNGSTHIVMWSISRDRLSSAVTNELDGLRTDVDEALASAGGLEEGSVEATHIADGAVSKVKLSQDVQDEIDAKADEDHTHTIGDVVNLRDELDGKSNAGHTHGIDDVSGLSGALAEKVDDTDPRLSDARTPTEHTHPWSEVSDKPSEFPPSSHTHSWASLTGKPTDFPPSTHTHQIADTYGLQDELDGKADQADLDAKADQSAVDGKVSNLGGVSGIESVTRAEYEALDPKDPTVIYAIREA